MVSKEKPEDVCFLAYWPPESSPEPPSSSSALLAGTGVGTSDTAMV